MNSAGDSCADRICRIEKENIDSDDAFKIVRGLAEELLTFLNQPEIEAQIRELHIPGTSSGKIQALILPKVVGINGLGFESERVGIFADYASGLRPDYFHHKAGILLEVERGKTHMNNMDLLDLWKCHICSQARYLFLIIPKARSNKKGKLIKQFHLTKNRLATFFEEKNYVSVDAVFLFGY